MKAEVESPSFTVAKLRAALAARKLPTTGLKAELRARLLEALENEDDEVSCSVQTSRSASTPSTP